MGSTEAEFREFVVARRQRMLRTAFLLAGEQERAQRLVQTSLVRVRRQWRQLTRAEDPETSLLRTIVAAYASRWRRLVARTRPQRTAAATGEHGHDDEDAAATGDMHADLWRALQALAPRTRAVLVLRYYEDLPEEDVAYLAGCRVETVRREEDRGLARLEERIAATEPAAAPDMAGESGSVADPGTQGGPR